MRPDLRELLANTTLRPIDLQAGRFLEQLTGKSDEPAILLAAALTSRAVADGHVCLPLDQLQLQCNRLIPAMAASPAELRSRLLATPVVGSPGSPTPLILDQEDNLYLHRYHAYEEGIARELRRRNRLRLEPDLAAGRAVLGELFPAAAENGTAPAKDPDWQYAATALSLLSPLLVVSGGPGTGKTFTVARIIAAQIAMAPEPLRIGLAAPTGKAATRLKDALAQAQGALPPRFARQMPDQALTLHRLLGFQPATGRFRHNRDNPLHLDMLLVDEASMIDIPLMAGLMEALPPKCRLILFGDRHQLASVEAGNLLADICSPGLPQWSRATSADLEALTAHSYPGGTASPAEMDDSVVQLQKSYRFQAGSGIATLAKAIQSDDPQALARCLRTPYPDLELTAPDPGRSRPRLEDFIRHSFKPIFSARSPMAALHCFEQSRILCGVHQGENGVKAVNQLAQELLLGPGRQPAPGRHYRGQPLMILQNDYALGLFNGDSGLIWPDEQGKLQAWFPGADGSLRTILPRRLPLHQTGYAITVHKSQGSEFDRVLLLLPGRDTPILNRELLYTGVTRARKHLTLEASPELLESTAARPAQRFSGLHHKLRIPW
ncbi:exodeoxyribonuclease V subunit alpha [Desulfogranum mediterraneum]|uniref:exodeoxyribonuclease V subunit alpha n=1 Tax=Desulfogranum mediterraneum TaxID=160661 RepID=UPI000688BDA2|nr:exodeoxyribonuclease V subunit alpha [Desulfogranum mediterraneum]